MSPCLDEVAFQKEKEAGMGIFGFSHRRRPAFIRLLAVPNPDPGMLTTLYQRIYDLLRLHLPLCNTSGKSSRVPSGIELFWDESLHPFGSMPCRWQG